MLAHEFRMTAANRAFIILTVLGPFLIAAMALVPGLIAERAQRKEVTIALPGADPRLLRQVRPPLEQAGIRVRASGESAAVLDRMVQGGGLYGYLEIPPDLADARELELVSREIVDPRVLEVLRGVIGQVVVERRMERAGLDARLYQELARPPEVVSAQITEGGRRVRQDVLSSILTGITFTLMLYMTILLYGQSIGRSVVQEKSYRTVEIVLSSVRAEELMFGKILGQALASLLQYAVWVGMAAVVLKVLGPRLGLAGMPAVGTDVLGFLVLFFLLGFFLYAAVYAALGAAAEDEQNLAQLSWPALLFLILPMVASGAIMTNPNGSFSVFLSLFPLTSPIVMFVRVLAGEPAPWQVLLSVGLLLVTIAAVIVLAARIFRVGILLTGRRFSLGEVLRWIRA